jgi:hypothetical protein
MLQSWALLDGTKSYFDCVRGGEPGEAAGLAGELSATTGNLYIFAFPHIRFLIWTEKGGTSAKTLALVVH